MVDEQVAKTKKIFENGYNIAIISTTAEMKKIKHVIYQGGFEYGLERA